MPKKKEPGKNWEVRTDRTLNGRQECIKGGGLDEVVLGHELLPNGKHSCWLHLEQLDTRKYYLALYGQDGKRNMMTIYLDKTGLVKTVYVQEEDLETQR